MKPVRFDSVDALAGEIIDRLAGNVVLGLPLGLGKPVALVDALYERALSDSSVQLTVLTALTLERPKVGGSGLRARFIGPILDRSFAGYQSPRYAVDQARDALPSNVQVIEFYVAPGSRLRSGQSQQSHASVNYTHAARMVRSRRSECGGAARSRDRSGVEPELQSRCDPRSSRRRSAASGRSTAFGAAGHGR